MDEKPPHRLQLRANAEAEVARAPPSEDSARPRDELLHELRVHQIELEMQNESLRQAQLILEESRDRYADLYEFAPVGYLTLTDKGLIAEINLTGAALLGKDRKALIQRRFAHFLRSGEQDRWHKHFLQMLRHGNKQACEIAFQRSDGTVFDAHLDCLLTTDAGGKPMLRVSLTDITARKQAEQAMQAAKIEAEEANAAKSHFLAAASHDLRQPLQALRLFFDILDKELDNPRHLKVVQMASAALAGGENLLHALLDVSKFDAGTVATQYRSVTFSEIAEALKSQCEGLARQKGLRLTVVNSSATIRSDPVLLSRLLRNLLNNAIKYTNQGRVLLGCRRVRDGVRIEVWDTGIGIAIDQQQRIFGDFYQIGNTSRDQSQGLGIGLAVVRRTADLLGHRITVRSWPGRGSVFAVTIGQPLNEGATHSFL